MLGISFVAVSLLLHQQLTTFSLLVPSTFHAASANGMAALPPADVAGSPNNEHTGDLGLGGRRDGNADEVDQLLAVNDNDDEWDPEEQQSDADSIAAFRSQQRYKFRPSSLASLFSGDRKQQQSAAAAAWLDGLAKRRAHIFVGKRSGGSGFSALGHQFGLRPADVAALTSDVDRQRFANDDDDSEIGSDKRSRMFVGKRLTSALLDGVHDLYEDESASNRLRGEQQLLSAEKRPRMFVGKKYAPVFVGKRSADENRLRQMASKP